MLRVITTTYYNEMQGLSYDGQEKEKTGRMCTIGKNSHEESRLADLRERGMSYPDIMYTLNETREKDGLPLIGVNAVRGAINRMKSKTRTLDKKSQGSQDPMSDWSRARNNWSTQLCVRFDLDPDLIAFKNDDSSLPVS